MAGESMAGGNEHSSSSGGAGGTPQGGRCKGWLSWRALLKLGIFLALVAVILVAFLVFKVEHKLGDFLKWLRDNKTSGIFIFVGLYALCTVLFVPGLILSLGAGYVFKIVEGTAAVWLGATIGQTLAFLLGRYLLKDWVASRTKGFVFWQAIDTAVAEEGWKIVGLLRLAPVIPYNVLNYALGLTSVKFWHYFFSSTFGILPGTILYVYVGSLVENLQEIISGDVGPSRTAKIVTAVISGVVIILVVVLTTYYAKREISRRLKEEEVMNEGALHSPLINEEQQIQGCEDTDAGAKNDLA